jgi:ATP-binding cassette subfamily B protein RaxB
MDEATSHLDLHSEQHIVKSLHQMTLTRITIAHRRETIAFAKRIVCLERGSIVEDVRLDEDQALA